MCIRDRGHTDEPLSKVRDNMPNSPMYSGITKHDPNVLRRSAEMSPAVAAFVMSYGIDFLPINPQQPFLLPSKPGSMPKFAQAMLDELQKRGVSVLLDSAATGLETQTEDKGQNRVTGVRFVREGKTQFIRARSVVLATGGFSDNRQLMRRYKRVWANIPKGFAAIGEGVPPGHDGDGITLGRLVGGAIEDMESMPKLFAAPKPGDRSPSWILFDTDTAYLVDKNGRRFCNEHESRYAGCALACFRQNIDGAYVVLDEATVTGPNKERWRYSDLLTAKALFKGQTIEEAATKAGVDPKLAGSFQNGRRIGSQSGLSGIEGRRRYADPRSLCHRRNVRFHFDPLVRCDCQRIDCRTDCRSGCMRAVPSAVKPQP